MQTVVPPDAPSGPGEPSWQQPGGLGIAERRSWATWHLSVAALLFLVVGMLIGYSGKRPASSSAASTSRITLPPPRNGTPTTSLAAHTTTTTASYQPGTTVAPTTTVASGGQSATATTSPAVTTAACKSPTKTLVPNTQGKGPSALPAFATTGPWCLGWAFSCSLAPGGSGPFTINVVSATTGSNTGSSPAVQETSRSSNGETPQGAMGSVRIQVTTDPACRWAVTATSG